MSTVDVEVTIQPKGRRKLHRDARALSAASPRIPRIARLMALAIKFQGMVDRCEVRDYADLARLGHVTRARVTQIMNLLHLAPDIQEQLLALASNPEVSQSSVERHIRHVSSAVEWSEQRKRWNARE